MLVAIVENDRVVNTGLLQNLYAGYQFPDTGPDSLWMAERGLVPAVDSLPHDPKSQKLVPQAPVLVDNRAVTVRVVDKTPEEIASDTRALAAEVRALRDAKIDAVSWRYERYARQTRLGWPTTDSITALDTYVQILADLPLQTGFPWQVNWPEEI